jgi:integrase
VIEDALRSLRFGDEREELKPAPARTGEDVHGESARAVMARLSPDSSVSPELVDAWLDRRERSGVGSFLDERTRLRSHVLPHLGKIPISELRPRHVRDMVASLCAKRSRLGGVFGPRTVRHIYATLHHVVHDAVVDEILPANPCVLRRGELPRKADKDPTWRSGAVFTREEVESLVSDERIAEDRRVLYAIEFFTGVRCGEAAALQWRSYNPNVEPLGRLLVATSYNSRSKRLKGTKTDQPREVPVHPTLARILAGWKLSGWRRAFGRQPTPEDLVVPALRGGCRNVRYSLMAFHDDLSRLGLRRRRHYDTRRTFISLAQADGARKDVLRWVTHGPTGNAFDAYTTLPWATLCEAVGYLRLGLREGKLVSLQGARAIAKPLPVGDGLETEASGVEAQKERAASSVACGP